jgi:hypothetical protein
MPVPALINHHRLPLRLRPLSVGELFLAARLESSVYAWSGDTFEEVHPPTAKPPGRDVVQQLLKQGLREIYVAPEDHAHVQANLEEALIRVTRSLSVGDPRENGSRALKLMAMNLGGLYRNPYDDELITRQFQSVQNMGKFLMDNRKHQATLYHDLAKENFHFTLLQPMLSSVLLLGFMQSAHLFHEREMEMLFMASYLKDLGIGLIPQDKYDLKGLTHDEEKLFEQHAHFSHQILAGRVPLSRNHLNIIQDHHFLNDRLKIVLTKQKRPPDETTVARGIESMMIAVSDVLVAMTTDRPYRKGMSVYQGLELIRMLMADDYPQEYRALVVYLRTFFKTP